MEIIDDLSENTAPEYAGFWIRFVAYFIDGLILSVVIAPIFFLFFTPEVELAELANDMDAMIAFYSGLSGLWFISFILTLLYFAGMQSSKYQATLGKMIIGVIVIDEVGNRISMGRGVGRYFAKILSGMIFYIGFIMAGFDSRKQALHDKLASTFVIYKN
jgi:uncharacterized RDD family membrane protein YckC